MNIAKSFVEYMEDQLLGTFGDDIFIGVAPQGAPDKCYWINTSGGAPQSRNQTGEVIKNYVLDVFYRNTDAEDVYDTIQALEILLNNGNCTQLSGFDTIEIQATLFPTDQDIDNQERTVGLIQVGVKTYYKE